MKNSGHDKVTGTTGEARYRHKVHQRTRRDIGLGV